jgi:signal transduction histidine kinase
VRLRARLALAAAGVALPVALALFGIDRAEHRRAAEARLLGFVQRTMPELRASCEADPAAFGGEVHPSGPPPPPGDPPPRARPARVYAYDASLRSANPAAPRLPAAASAALARADAVPRSPGLLGDEVAVLARLPWREGPCAVVLATGTTDPSWGAILPDSYLWLLPTLGVFAATLAAAGPLVRRIRLLTAAVARSAARAYADPVDLGGADELADLARAFDAAGAEVRRRLDERDAREQALRQFLANTTHDVMLPLTALQGHLSALREQAAGAGRVDARVIVAAMDEAHYAASLLADLVAAARLDGAEPRLDLAPVDLGALVRRVAGRHATIARELGVSLDHAVPGDPLVTLADVTLLEQAVSNVAYNAVHYNRPGGHVAIVLEPTLRDGAAAFSLRVLDDGPGLPDDELARLAERGFRGHEARSRRPDGQGLGLHIARRAADLHGLSLRFGRSEAGGLEVTFEGALRAAG